MGTVESGTASPSSTRPDELRQIAIHEAGQRPSATPIWAKRTRLRASRFARARTGSGALEVPREDDRFVHFRSEHFKDVLDDDGRARGEHVFYGEKTSGVGGDMSSVAHQAAIMVGPPPCPERVPLPATMTPARKRPRTELDDYSSTRAASCSLSHRSRPLRKVLRAPRQAAMAARIIGQATSSPTISPSRTRRRSPGSRTSSLSAAS